MTVGVLNNERQNESFGVTATYWGLKKIFGESSLNE